MSFNLNDKQLLGIVIDDRDAILDADGGPGASLVGYFSEGYLYVLDTVPATGKFELVVNAPGRFEVRVSDQPHENCGTGVPVTTKTQSHARTVRLIMKLLSELEFAYSSQGEIQVAAGETVPVSITSSNSVGITHVDSFQGIRVH